MLIRSPPPMSLGSICSATVMWTWPIFSGQYTAQDYFQGDPVGSPYSIDVTPGDITGNNKGTLILNNVFEIPVPFTINLDWSDPSNFTTEVPIQPWFFDPTDGQTTLRPNNKGAFSSCKNSFRIEYELTVPAFSYGKFSTEFTR